MKRLPPEELYPAHDPDIRVRYLTLRSGVRVRAVEAGDPAGPAVLFLHGWAGSVYLFRRNVPALAAAGFRAIAVDLKGHGLSDKPRGMDGYTLPAMTAHVLEILDALGLARVALAGQSMSGAFATEVALAAPDRVTHVVLLGAVGFCRIRAAIVGKRCSPRIVRPLLPYLAFRWVVKMVLGIIYGRLIRWTERDVDEYWAPTADPAFMHALHSLVHRMNWWPNEDGRLRALRAPLLVVRGDCDPVIPEGALDRYRADVPHARILDVPGAGHNVNEEAPDVVNAEMVAFLRSGRTAS